MLYVLTVLHCLIKIDSSAQATYIDLWLGYNFKILLKCWNASNSINLPILGMEFSIPISGLPVFLSPTFHSLSTFNCLG